MVGTPRKAMLCVAMLITVGGNTMFAAGPPVAKRAAANLYHKSTREPRDQYTLCDQAFLIRAALLAVG